MPVMTWASHHRIWTVGIGLLSLAAVVAVIGAGLWYFLLRSPSTQVNLSQALRLYRHAQKGGQGDDRNLPPSGVYRYTTSGNEHLSFGGISRSFPATSDMIVTSTAGCATVKWEPLEQHVEGLTECPSKVGGSVFRSAYSYEDIAGSRTTSLISCAATAYLIPPDPSIGERWHSTCRSSNESVGFTGHIVGDSYVDVGKTEVPAIHTRIVFTFSGSESGVNPNDYWISLRGGLILHQNETVDVSQSAGPLGSVRYTEQMKIALRSTTPTR
jgi:hypothetical protein